MNAATLEVRDHLGQFPIPICKDILASRDRFEYLCEVPTRVATLFKKQKGKCAHCGIYFKDGDFLEVDHIVPRSKGGKDKYDNWQLLHRHCHDTKTANDGSLGNKSNCNSVKPKPPVKT